MLPIKRLRSHKMDGQKVEKLSHLRGKVFGNYFLLFEDDIADETQLMEALRGGRYRAAYAEEVEGLAAGIDGPT